MKSARMIVVLAAGAPWCVARADFTFPDFSSTTGLNLVSNAAVNGTDLRVAPALEGQLGAVWFAQKQAIAAGFTTEFRFRITDPGGVPDFFGGMGADGLAFVIQNSDANVIGNPGSGMGYEGIANSLAVEFDTWGHPFFGDPNGNHVSVQSLGTQPNSYTPQASLGLNQNVPELTSGQVFTARVVYVPGTLRVFIDNTEVLSVAVDLATLLTLDKGRAWVGFTSSTGGAWENHDLLSWSFTSGGPCYANCDGSTGTPALNVNDFVCFQTRFAAGDPYANCDGSTGTPVLNVLDFVCFQSRFAAGCR